MLLLSCQKCGELQVLPGSLEFDTGSHVSWTCAKCGAGQLLELPRRGERTRGDLNKVVAGLALKSDAPGIKQYRVGPDAAAHEIQS